MLLNDIIELRNLKIQILVPKTPLDLNFGLRVLKVTELKMIDARLKFSGLLYGCRTKII